MKLNWLTDVIPVEVSYVDKPAIDRRFLYLKRLNEEDEIEEKFAGSPKNKYGTHSSKGFKSDYEAAWKCHFSKVGGGSTSAAASGPIRGTVRRVAMIAARMKPKCDVIEGDNIGARKGPKSPLDCSFASKPSDYGLSKWAKPSDDDLTQEDVQLTCKDLNVIKKAAMAEIKRRAEDREKTKSEIDETLLGKIKNKIMETLGLVDTKIGRVLSKSNEDKLLQAANSIINAGEIIKDVLSSINKKTKEDEEMDEKEIRELVNNAIDEKLGAFEKNLVAKLNKLLFEEPKVEEPEVKEPGANIEGAKKKGEEKEEKPPEEKTSEGSLLTRITAVIEKKFEGFETRIEGIEKELNIKPESDKKKVNKKEIETKTKDDADFTGVFGFNKL